MADDSSSSSDGDGDGDDSSDEHIIKKPNFEPKVWLFILKDKPDTFTYDA